MSEDSTTQCLLFPGIFRKACSGPSSISARGVPTGGALAAEGPPIDIMDWWLGLASCLRDERQAWKGRHFVTRVGGRRGVFSDRCGYPGCQRLGLACPGIRFTNYFWIADPIEGRDLASQPTLSRFENGVGVKELYRAGEFLAGEA